MSDRQSKSHEKQKKTLYLPTRYKSDAYIKNRAQAHTGILSSSSCNIAEPSNARHGISTRTKHKAVSDGLSTPEDYRRQKKTKKNDSRINNFGSEDEDMDIEDIMIKKIDADEFYNTIAGVGPSAKRQVLKGDSSAASSWKGVDSVSNCSSQRSLFRKGKYIGPLAKKGVNTHFATSYSKNVGAVSKNQGSRDRSRSVGAKSKYIGPSAKKSVNAHFATSYSKNVGAVSKNQGSRDRSRSVGAKRKCIENDDFEGIEIGKNKFLKYKAISSSSRLNEAYSASHSSQNVGRTTKKTSSCHGFDQPSSCELSLSVQGGSDSEDTDSDSTGVEIISEAEFMKQKKARLLPKKNTIYGKNVNNGARRNNFSADKNVEYGRYKSGPSVRKEKCCNKHMSSKGIETEGTDDEVELRNEISSVARKGRYYYNSADNSRKNAVVFCLKDVSCSGSFSSGDDDDSRDLAHEESSSSAETGNKGDEDTDEEDNLLEKISELEFRKKKATHLVSVPKNGSSKKISSEKNANKEKKLKSIQRVSPDLSTGSSNDISTDDGTRTGPEINSGVKKGSGVESVMLDLPGDSKSSSSSSDDEDPNKTISEIFLNKEKQLRKNPDQMFEENEETDKILCDADAKAVSPSHSSDDILLEEINEASSDIHGHCENEKTEVAEEIEKPEKSKQDSSEWYGLCRMIADSVLGRGSMLEAKIHEESKQAPKEPQIQVTLPLRFCFEDEVQRPVEKTEHEKEVEALFAELDFCWESQGFGSFKYPEVDRETESSPAEETQYARCTAGNHELVLIDDQGLVCKYCHHVELGPKDVLPEWAEKTYREFERKRLFETTEQPLEFDELHLKSLTDDHLDDPSNVANGTVWSLKPGIHESMYEHQQQGFEFLWKNLAGSTSLNELKMTPQPGEIGGCIISHAPGTGKTRLTIVFIETYMKLFPNCRPVIIAPAGMLLTWEEEFRKWNVEFPFINLNNTEISDKEKKIALGLLVGPKNRDMNTIRMVNLYTWSRGGAVLGISYSLFEKLTGENKHSKKTPTVVDSGAKDLRTILLEKPGLVVLDEGHTPRNQRSNIWNVLLKLRTEKRVILSGTPFQNNFSELFNTLHLVRPAIADTLAQEKALSEMINSRKKYKAENSQFSEVDSRAVERLKTTMAPFVHVHKGTILQQSLPGLRDCVVVLKPPALQKSLIEKLEGTQSTFQFEHKAALLSVHPYLFQHSDSTEEERIGIDVAAIEATRLNPNEGVKTKFILEFVRLSMVIKEKVLVFSQYIQPLELIKEHLKEVFKWVDGKQILRMQGKLDQRQRQNLINMFNDVQNESRVMLASTRCCSEGISLVGASRVILLDVVWNPSVERQAISRAYRIGQKKFVYTYHLMTCGTTEADKYCRQTDKERMSELVFTSSSNEKSKNDDKVCCSEDNILGSMVDRPDLKDMFDKIINQPKDMNLIQSFGLMGPED
ncbi:hypothetical protein CASFOL_007576 [Castilleja foliolosa]|uniref:Uncharacterized protein n=1 Tax=Castilleja foliolosa TaxID=1961234 RepID=A0ABD3E9P3_9LAMI